MGDRRARSAFRNRPARSAETGREQRGAVKDKPCSRVKLANIELTPENPEYNGGVWHVEGMENENIVASGIYYYTSENITPSLLGFRAAVKEPDYEVLLRYNGRIRS